VRTTPEQLLEVLVERWSRGEPLAVEELLEQAGPRADELADLVDAFLERAPRREPTPEAIAYVQSLDQPLPLLRARQERRLKLDDLAAALVERLGLPEEARAKVRRHYQDLELGRLDPAGVAASVWAALAGLLGRDARDLAGVPPPPVMPAAAMYREADFAQTLDQGIDLLLRSDRGAEPDEADRLFGVGPEA
jgi:hypothetical protein